MRFVISIFVLLMLFFPAVASAKRVALVIGNGDYQFQPKLRNPVPDAKAIAARLEAAKFEVTLGADLTNEAMRQTINRFAATVPGASAALLFFAGHGVQVDGEIYLIPIDADIARVTDLTWQTIAVSTLVNELEGPGRTSIIILDACRNNPGLARWLRGLSLRSRALNIGRGLAQVSAPDGACVAFSTAPDTVALDGQGEHSPFAKSLIKHIVTPGLDIALMMRRVRQDVRKLTNRQQTPWDSSSLTQPFYFVPANTSPNTQSRLLPSTSPRPVPPYSRLTIHEAFKEAQAIGTRDAYEYFLHAYPQGYLSNIAKAWKKKNCNENGRDLAKKVIEPAIVPPMPQVPPKFIRPKASSGSMGKSGPQKRRWPAKNAVRQKRASKSTSSKPKRSRASETKSCFANCVRNCIDLRHCEWRCSRQC